MEIQVKYKITFLLISGKFPMAAPDRNELIPAPQKKLKWVTPKISPLEGGTTNGKEFTHNREDTNVGYQVGS